MKLTCGRAARSGHTLVETIVAALIFALLTLGTVSMLMTSTVAVGNARAQVYADTDANLAMQAIVSDLREATSVAIYNGTTRVALGTVGNCLLLTKPRVVSATGEYNRFNPDTANPTRYYLSDNTGSTTRTGTVLWQRQEQTGALRRLRSGVRDLRFLENAAGRVEVSLTVESKAAQGTKQTELSERVVYMRNGQ